MVSCHPSGGPPDEKSVSHLKPVPSVLDAMDAGPPRDGILFWFRARVGGIGFSDACMRYWIP
jgi:hypothetical protein